MPLHGHDIDGSTTPWEAGLDWIVKLDKGDFIGREALLQQRGHVSRKLVGFEMTGRGIARDGYQVLVEGEPVSTVTEPVGCTRTSADS